MFNDRFHKSRTFRSVLTLLIWIAGLLIVKPYSISPLGVILLLVTWFILESAMYGWDLGI